MVTGILGGGVVPTYTWLLKCHLYFCYPGVRWQLIGFFQRVGPRLEVQHPLRLSKVFLEKSVLWMVKDTPAKYTKYTLKKNSGIFAYYQESQGSCIPKSSIISVPTCTFRPNWDALEFTSIPNGKPKLHQRYVRFYQLQKLQVFYNNPPNPK